MEEPEEYRGMLSNEITTKSVFLFLKLFYESKITSKCKDLWEAD